MRMPIHHWRKRIRLIILMMVLFSFAMFQGGFVSWFLFYTILPFCLYTFLLSFYSAKKWNVTAELNSTVVQAGDAVGVVVYFHRPFPFPIPYLVVEQQVSKSLYRYDEGNKKYTQLGNDFVVAERKLKRMIYPGFKKNFSLKLELDKLPRGEHKLESVIFTYGDPFGYLEKRFEVTLDQKLTVLPRIHQLKLRLAPSYQEEGIFGMVEYEAKKTNTVASVREYVAGDRFSWIDWKTTARKNTMMTKEFEQEKELDTTCILDLSGDESRSQLSMEASIDFAVSLLQFVHRKQQQTNFLLFGEHVKRFSYEQIQYHFDSVVHYLAKLENKPIAFSQQRPLWIQNQTCIWILTHLTKQKAMKINKWKRTVPNLIVFYISPEEVIQKNQYWNDLQVNGVRVFTITEKELSQLNWEVDKR